MLKNTLFFISVAPKLLPKLFPDVQNINRAKVYNKVGYITKSRGENSSFFVVWYAELTREPEKARSVFFGKILSFPLHPNCSQIVPKRAGGGAVQRETAYKIIY